MAKKTAKQKTAKQKTVEKGTKSPEDCLKELSKLSKEELLIRLGQLMSENAALRQKTSLAVKTTRILRNAANKYLRQPLEDTMRDYED